MARDMYTLTLKGAECGITHGAHIMTGWNGGEAIGIKTYRDISKKWGRRFPLTKTQYNDLVDGLQDEWWEVLKQAEARRVQQKDKTLRELIKHEPLIMRH